MAKPLAGNNVSFSMFLSQAQLLNNHVIVKKKLMQVCFFLKKIFFPFWLSHQKRRWWKKSKLDLLTIVPLERSLLPKCTLLLPTISKNSFSLFFAAIYYQNVYGTCGLLVFRLAARIFGCLFCRAYKVPYWIVFSDLVTVWRYQSLEGTMRQQLLW